jgi:ribosomal protein L16 Arg81 hydroxylase
MILPISESQFLAQYWQKKPLLCPQALPQFKSPLSPEELAGLAMEPDIESRLVWQQKEFGVSETGPLRKTSLKAQSLGRCSYNELTTGTKP